MLPDEAELAARTAIVTKKFMLCSLPSADGCGDDEFVNIKSEGSTQLVMSAVPVWISTRNDQTAAPLLAPGGGVVDGMIATYGYRKYNRGKPRMK